jgi:alpha-glucosidase
MQMKRYCKLILAVVTILVWSFECLSDVIVQSPDGRNAIKVFSSPLSYEVIRDGITVASRSAISMTLESETLSGEGKVPKISYGKYSGEETSKVYKKSSVNLAGNWLYADYGDWGVRFAARNDGVAYRFETAKQGKIKVLAEASPLSIPDGEAKCWVNFTGNPGCEESYPLAKRAHEIVTHSKGKIYGWMGRRYIYLPFVYTVRGKAVAVTESDIYDYPVWNLVRPNDDGKGVFNSWFSPWPLKTSVYGRHLPVEKRANYLVETDGTRTFPWRTFVLADEGEMSKFAEADIVYALARPKEKGSDFSWVKPGKVAWDWWNAFDNKGTEKGCTTKTYLRFVDFAAKNNVEYVILDEGWSEKLNIWKYHSNVDVPQIVEHARAKGVGIILWMAWSQVKGNEERVVEKFGKLGVKGFKVDFMDRSDAECERFLWKFADACSKAKLLVDYHGVHRPAGMSRAYPNVINYEAVHGLEQTKWYLQDYDFMANDVRVFFLRMTAGPMDYTPGAMDNYPIGRYKGDTINPGSVGTRARQMALMALYEAPLQMLCDSPTKYEKNMECFTFMAATPVVWTATVGLGGCPDTYAAVARKAADGSWYAAAITDASRREIVVDSAKFLENGEWEVEIFRDAADADKKPTNFIHEKKTVKAGELLSYKTAPGGGFVAKFVRKGTKK